MSIPKDGKQKYVETYSHNLLAKEWETSLSTLDTYAVEQGWDREHKLYWQDVALEVLKKAVEEQNLGAVKELLKATGHTRPVGRPPKAEVDKHIAIEARAAKEYTDDVARMRVVRDN
jgi:hypothetical protein